MRRFCLSNLMLAFALIGISVFVSCNTEDVDYKGATLSVSAPTPPLVGPAGGSSEFTIESNRPWTIEIPTTDKAWASVDPQTGEGNAKVTVTLLGNGGEERVLNLKVKTTSTHEYVKITQSGEIATAVLLNVTFGTELGTTEPPTKWPYLDAFKGDLGISGEGSSAVVVSGSGTTLRGNGKPSDQPGASAGTHAFMSKTGVVTINKIATGGAANFSLSFGVTRYIFDTKDNTFKPELMTLSVSTDGTSYTPVTYQYTPFEANKFWGICKATFSVTAGSPELFVKFTNADTEGGDSRIDDVVVKATGEVTPPTEVVVATGAATAVTETGATLAGSYVGPQEAVITELGVEYKTGAGAYQAVIAPSAIVTPFTVAVTGLTKDTEYTYRAYAKVTGKGTIYGTENTFRTAGAEMNALYNESVGTIAAVKDGSKWPFVDQYTTWTPLGSLSQTGVTYTGNNASVRTSEASLGKYPGASGVNSVFFGSSPNEFVINNINITGKTNFTFSFGISNIGGQPSVATPIDANTVKLQASLDATTWTDLTYTNASTASWVVASSMFKAPAGSTKLYVKFSTSIASLIRIDDFTLVEGGSGAVIIGGGGVAPTDPAVTTVGATDVTETGAVLSGSYVAPESTIFTELGVEYKTGAGTYIAQKALSAVVTPFAVTITGLTKDTEYTYRAYAKTATATYTGEEKTFTTAGAAKTYVTVAELRAKGETTIAEDLFVKASMVSSQTGGNSTSLKNIVIADDNAGIAVRLTANAETLAVGDQVEISLKGVQLQKYLGLLQLNNMPNANMTKLGTSKVITPVSISATQLLTGAYESRPVAVADVQILNEDLGKTMVVGGQHTSLNVEAKTGEKFILFTSSYAAFKDVTAPSGSGILKGLGSVNTPMGSTAVIQVLPQVESDFSGMTGARFGTALVLTYSAALEGTMRVGTAFVATNKVVLSYTGAKAGDAYSVSMAVTGAGASGITTPVTTTGTFSGIVGEIDLALTGTPATEGAVVFTITGAGASPIVVNGMVSPAGGTGDPVYTSNVTLPTGANSTDSNYGEKINLSGNEFPCLKLGTGSKVGKYTTPTLPATGLTLSLYSAVWKDKTAKLKITVNNGGTINGAASAEIDPKANVGATGIAPYTMTLTTDDLYTFRLDGITAASTLTFETIKGSDFRAILVGVNVK